MLGWILDIISEMISIFNTVTSSLEDLVDQIDAVTFDETNVLYQFLGMVRYVVGDPIYILISVLLSTGLLLIIYRLTLIVVQVVSNLIPGMKGRITVR